MTDNEVTRLREAERLYADGHIEDSEAVFEALLESRLRAEGLYGLGMICWKRGDLPRAQNLLEQSLGVRRSNANALCALGRMHSKLGSTLSARALLGEALSIDPNHSGTLRELPRVLGGEGAGDTSLPESPKATIEPPHPPRPPTRENTTVGLVHSLVKALAPIAHDQLGLQIWTFRVDVHDGRLSGGPTTIGVEMRGHEINGVLENGDWVALLDQPEPNRVYQPKEVFNLTLNAPVKSRMRWLTA